MGGRGTLAGGCGSVSTARHSRCMHAAQHGEAQHGLLRAGCCALLLPPGGSIACSSNIGLTFPSATAGLPLPAHRQAARPRTSCLRPSCSMQRASRSRCPPIWSPPPPRWVLRWLHTGVHGQRVEQGRGQGAILRAGGRLRGRQLGAGGWASLGSCPQPLRSHPFPRSPGMRASRRCGRTCMRCPCRAAAARRRLRSLRQPAAPRLPRPAAPPAWEAPRTPLRA